MGIFAGAARRLQNDRGIELFAGFHNPLYDFHIVDIEGTDRVAALIGFFEHFLCVDKGHFSHPPVCYYIPLYRK